MFGVSRTGALMPRRAMSKAKRVSSMLQALLVALPALAACEAKPSPSPAPAASAVTPVETAVSGSPADSAPRVEVTSEGFQPARVVLGSDRHVVFRRVADGTCATAVVFPSLGIEKQLPLNTDVTLELPPGSPGELAFQCGMGMYRGKVVAQ